MVGHIMQYHPVFKKLKALVHNGAIGKLNYIYSNRKAFGIFRAEENVVLSLAPHDVSMILALVNDFPSSINSFRGSYLQENIDDFANIHLDFKNNIKASINVSWLNPIKEQKLVIIGEDGMFVFDDTLEWDQKLALYKHKIAWNGLLPSPIKEKVQYIQVEYAEPLNEECRHFIKLINDDAIDITNGIEGRDVLAVLDAANK
jgi:UDP-2-acetamido-3-amino-2,3-dideoxy-glucuronate N-acetyltransferase